ncbi:cyclin mcs2 [Thecamonas trahens ATCC 50062]|uniref:Cyclin mcs2 n=1 Tax=Thecamonas trahens ATCC 50062 TaxID=461836 RepID=A0A0L0DXA5_THETB|nr:cyclin mcs2 [Thecamonas trahens ATCC 50062]KNC56158.1 cyclin mcs2 [Thecamonas trahens ATCC 50062]|eukprot:XP_013761195.1 cyclin mcs2 [Thecamonas trahens ATCC 50062]
MGFETSSHAKHWLFTEDTILRMRKESHARGVAGVLAAYADHAEFLGTPPADDAFPSVEDETVLVDFYAQQMWVLCKKVELPPKVFGCAVIFLKRFYLKTSVLEYVPKEVMLTALVLAAKSEEVHIAPSAFAAKFKVKPEAIIALEIMMLEKLSFHLMVYQVWHPIGGFVDMFRRLDPECDWQTLRDEAMEWARDAMLSDLILQYPPSQLALAATCLAADEAGLDADTFLAHQFPGPENDALRATIRELENALDTASQTTLDKAAARAANAALDATRNPLLDPESALSKHLAERALEDKATAQLAELERANARRAAKQRELMGFDDGGAGSSSDDAPVAMVEGK